MCGRYGRRTNSQYIAEHYRVRDCEDHGLNFPPSYNVAPQTVQPVVRLDHDTGAHEIAAMKWGLTPYWSKSPKLAVACEADCK